MGMSFYGQIIEQITGALSAIKFKSGNSIQNTSEITVQGDDNWIDVNGAGSTINITHKTQSDGSQLVTDMIVINYIDGNILKTQNVTVDAAGHITEKSNGADIIIPKFIAEDDGFGNVRIS